jgi:Ni/Fe-hydrogenase subunit HybB-like protein
MLAEMTDNDPKAYAWLAVVLNIAQTLLPATTGILYQAARTNWQQPAVLPCLLTAALIAAVALVVCRFVDEVRVDEDR